MQTQIKMIKKLLKEKFSRLLAINVLFTIFLIAISVLIKKQITLYISELSLASSQLQVLQTALQENITANLQATQTQLASLNSTVTNVLLFGYIAIPLIFFILYTLFQAYNFYIISNEKNFKKYLLRFSLATIPFYVVFIFLLKALLNQTSQFSSIYFIVYGLISIILPYFALMVYFNLNNLKNIKNSLKKFKLILYYLPILILLSLYLLACFFIGVYILAEIVLPIIIGSIVLLVIISLIILLELKFNSIVEK